MSRYLFQVSYSQEAWKSMIAKPQNRLDLVGEMLSSHGITIVDGYATFGEYDLIAIFEAPDDKTVAAASILVSSSVFIGIPPWSASNLSKSNCPVSASTTLTLPNPANFGN